jgi:hypothetical protein
VSDVRDHQVPWPRRVVNCDEKKVLNTLVPQDDGIGESTFVFWKAKGAIFAMLSR